MPSDTSGVFFFGKQFSTNKKKKPFQKNSPGAFSKKKTNLPNGCGCTSLEHVCIHTNVGHLPFGVHICRLLQHCTSYTRFSCFCVMHLGPPILRGIITSNGLREKNRTNSLVRYMTFLWEYSTFSARLCMMCFGSARKFCYVEMEG